MLDSKSKCFALALRKIGLFGEKKSTCNCYRSNQMPLADQITEIVPNVGTYIRVSISNISTMVEAVLSLQQPLSMKEYFPHGTYVRR